VVTDACIVVELSGRRRASDFGQVIAPASSTCKHDRVFDARQSSHVRTTKRRASGPPVRMEAFTFSSSSVGHVASTLYRLDDPLDVAKECFKRLRTDKGLKTMPVLGGSRIVLDDTPKVCSHLVRVLLARAAYEDS